MTNRDADFEALEQRLRDAGVRFQGEMALGVHERTTLTISCGDKTYWEDAGRVVECERFEDGTVDLHSLGEDDAPWPVISVPWGVERLAPRED